MAAGDLCALADAQRAAGISGTPNSETATILGQLISALSAYVPQVINRQILLASYSESYRGNGGDQILLRQRPVVSISQIAWLGQTLSAAGDPISGQSGIWTDGRNACLSGYCFPKGLIVRIAYQAGYSSVPADLAWACAELVAEAYAGIKHVGESSRSQGGQITVSYDMKAMHSRIADKLKNYRHGAPC